MDGPIDKAQLIDRIRQARADWDALIVQFDDAQLLQAGFCQDWSAKDVMAHLTWHEREMIGVIQAHALVGSELWDLPLDQRNAAIYALNKERTLQDVRSEAGQVFKSLLGRLATLSEEDLHDPGRFPGMPPDWQPWKLIAENTYEHYQDHLPQAQAWLVK